MNHEPFGSYSIAVMQHIAEICVVQVIWHQVDGSASLRLSCNDALSF